MIKGFVVFTFHLFFWQNRFFRLFSAFLPFFVRGHFEGLKFLHPKISKMSNQSVFLLLSQIFYEKTYYIHTSYKFRMQKWVILWTNFYHFFVTPIILTNFKTLRVYRYVYLWIEINFFLCVLCILVTGGKHTHEHHTNGSNCSLWWNSDHKYFIIADFINLHWI